MEQILAMKKIKLVRRIEEVDEKAANDLLSENMLLEEEKAIFESVVRFCINVKDNDLKWLKCLIKTDEQKKALQCGKPRFFS
jgi:hypothetical protein